MSAQVSVQEGNGNPVTWTTIENARFCTADTYNPGTNYKIPIPASGINYSFWKSHCLAISGVYTEISNVRWYTDGTGFGTGVEVYVCPSGLTEDQYSQATGIEGKTGDEMVANHPHVLAASGAFNYTSTNPLLVDAGPISGTAITNHIVLQMAVNSNASPGQLSAETFTFVYDEV